MEKGDTEQKARELVLRAPFFSAIGLLDSYMDHPHTRKAQRVRRKSFNVNRSARQTAATREAPTAVWRWAGGFVGRLIGALLNTFG